MHCKPTLLCRDPHHSLQLLGALPQLSVLSADDNRLTALPPAVATLARLSKLSLNGNQIGRLVGGCVWGARRSRRSCFPAAGSAYCFDSSAMLH